MPDKKRNPNQDNAGIRLAPHPMADGDVKRLNEVTQAYVLTPKLKVDAPKEEMGGTSADMQPREEDVLKKNKRRRRTVNMVFGAVMTFVTVAALIPYVLSAVGVKLSISVQLLPVRFDVIGGLIDAVSQSVRGGADLGALWLKQIPLLILAVGILALIINLIKSVLCFFGSAKPRRYEICAAVYLVTAIALLVGELAGFEEIGLMRPDFSEGAALLKEELFIIALSSAGYFLLSAICSALSSDKLGYIR